MNFSNSNDQMPFYLITDGGVEITNHNGAYHFEYLVSNSEDMWARLTLPETELEAFLKRNNIKSLEEVDFDILMEEEAEFECDED